MKPHELIGKKVKAVVRTEDIVEEGEFVGGASMCIVFEDNTILIPASDDEFNGYGTLNYQRPVSEQGILWGNSTHKVNFTGE